MDEDEGRNLLVPVDDAEVSLHTPLLHQGKYLVRLVTKTMDTSNYQKIEVGELMWQKLVQL